MAVVIVLFALSTSNISIVLTFLVLFFEGVVFHFSLVGAREYDVAIVGPITGAADGNQSWTRYGWTVAQMAAADANRNILASVGARLNLRGYDTNQDDTSTAVRQTIVALNLANSSATPPFAVIGCVFSSATIPVAEVTGSFAVPLVSWQATSTVLSDKGQYPFFSRVVPSDAHQGEALAYLVASLGIQRVAIIAENSDYGLALAQSFAQTAASLPVEVLVSRQVADSATPEQIQQVLADVAAVDARYIALFGVNNAPQAVLTEARNVGMYGAPYTWIGESLSVVLLADCCLLRY